MLYIVLIGIIAMMLFFSALVGVLVGHDNREGVGKTIFGGFVIIMLMVFIILLAVIV